LVAIDTQNQTSKSARYHPLDHEAARIEKFR